MALQNFSDTISTGYAQGKKQASQLMQNLLSNKVQHVRSTAQSLLNYSKTMNIRAINENNIENLPLQMSRAANEYKQLMKHVTDFQIAVNSFMGIKIEMAYVWIGRNRVELGREDLSEQELFVDRKSSSHGGGISGRYRVTAARVAKMKQFDNQLSSYNVSNLNQTLLTSYERYRVSRKQNRIMTGGNYGIVWWEMNSTNTEAVRLSSAGPLGEAYVAFYSNLYKGFGTNIEKNIKTFITHQRYGAIKADTLSGFLYGDVQGKDGTWYAVKMAGASAMGYAEILDFAQSVLNATDIQQAIKEFEARMEKKKSDLVQHLGSNLDKETEELINLTKSKLTNPKIFDIIK